MSETNEYDNLYLDDNDEILQSIPYIEGKTFLINGEIREWEGKMVDIHTPIYTKSKPGEQIKLGSYPWMDEATAVEAVDAAAKAFNNGRGHWPTSHVSERIKAVENFTIALKDVRNQIVELIMWEICKTRADAEKEVDRTIQYIFDTIKTLKKMENEESTFTQVEGIISQCRRAPIGVCLCSGPFNYPFNETYCTLIPAIIMGNTVVMKLPRVGILCHWPTWPLFQKFFPPGVINVVCGSGRSTLPPIMKSGKIDVFGFIGTSQAADALQSAHPKPHRLRVCLGLEAKNPAIIFSDADIDLAVSECILGSFSYNGQRCTAIKIIFVHKSIADVFVAKFSEAVDRLPMGLPWQAGVKITPLPEPEKPRYLRTLIDDAIAHGATIVNKRGNKWDRTFFSPTVLYPTSPQMRIYHEEQFGPVIPIYSWESIEEVYSYLAESNYGQQAAVFSTQPEFIAPMIDILVNQVSRVNLNCQCQRGPDILPFTGRKDSAYGTLSVFDALRVFSIRALVATKDLSSNQSLVHSIVDNKSSNFLRLDYQF